MNSVYELKQLYLYTHHNSVLGGGDSAMPTPVEN